MARKHFFHIWIFCSLLLWGNAFAQIINFEEKIDKIYISSDKILVTEKGIFVLFEGNDSTLTKVAVQQVNYDDNGMFVQVEHIPLPLALERCGRWHLSSCSRCLGCDVSGCPFQCKCR